MAFVLGKKYSRDAIYEEVGEGVNKLTSQILAVKFSVLVCVWIQILTPPKSFFPVWEDKFRDQANC